MTREAKKSSSYIVTFPKGPFSLEFDKTKEIVEEPEVWK